MKKYLGIFCAVIFLQSGEAQSSFSEEEKGDGKKYGGGFRTRTLFDDIMMFQRAVDWKSVNRDSTRPGLPTCCGFDCTPPLILEEDITPPPAPQSIEEYLGVRNAGTLEAEEKRARHFRNQSIKKKHEKQYRKTKRSTANTKVRYGQNRGNWKKSGRYPKSKR